MNDLELKVYNEIESSSKFCDDMISLIVKNCCKDLDDYIDNISLNFNNISNVDDQTLDNIILNLPMLIYYASSKLELISVREDMSALAKKQKLISVLTSLDPKVGNKTLQTMIAESKSSEQSVLNTVYNCAYKTVKSKLDTAYELLASCKKIMSRRIEVYKVEHSDTGRQILNS